MSKDYKAEFKDVSSEYMTLQNAATDTLGAFGQLHKAAMGDGALPGKYKELIAMAIGVGLRCEGCVVSHTRAAVKKGATQQEIAEAVGVAVMMAGGPGTVYGAKAIEAAKQFAEA
ncbi:MAG: carboxymuconolactone decarboxylase family protein [Candidatus Hydrogenedentota bacterium]